MLSCPHIAFKTHPPSLTTTGGGGGLWFVFSEHKRTGAHLGAPITGGGCWEPLGPQSCLSWVGPGVEIADPNRPAGGSNGGLLGAFGGFLLTSSSSPPGSLCPHSSTAPSPFPAQRLSVFGGDYAVLTLEYELGRNGSQILELGKAGAQAGIQEWLEHLCLDCSRCLTLPPT